LLFITFAPPGAAIYFTPPRAYIAAMTVLLTGAAGFIGYHTAKRLLASGLNVVGIDNFNDYYDPALKHARLSSLESFAKDSPAKLIFQRLDVADTDAVMDIFKTHEPSRVIHLAAQAGVRYSLENPLAYVTSQSAPMN